MHVHAISSDWYSGFGSCHMASGQIFVDMKIPNSPNFSPCVYVSECVP